MYKTLLIDASDNKKIVVGLKIDSKEFVKKKKLDTSKAQATLPMIMEILLENNLTLKDLDAIKVNTGPGSFTGLRVGMSVANALGFALRIPVNGKKIGNFAQGPLRDIVTS
ncbi:MAG: tRNA (adenosine(37)-N6)-threonylcarbamoyltransferase complex dimerization subunit type 1 TsaB [Candidatus Levybacteria bacterium]|nr:tRNA (adenosine(37)-N6)-threonylcarbamoyltransferase complex dimerization subunit type 1 TsaB [Candidatus Levybacteria bacterium]